MDQETVLTENFEAFERHLPELMKSHRGKFALVYDKEIVGLYDTIRDAFITGETFLKKGRFSIQEIEQEPANLGFYSYAGAKPQPR